MRDNPSLAKLTISENATMDHLDAIRAAVAVADDGSFAGAARRLRISAVSVTRAVAQVEAEIGAALFARTTRSVRLTEAGAGFVERCRRILADLDEARSLARGDTAEPRGRLTVAAPVVFGRLHVLPVVEALIARHPALDVQLTLSDRLAHLVEERVDVAVRIGALADSALTAVRIASVRPVLAASPGYLVRRGAPRDLASLDDHDLIVFEGLDSTDDWRFGERRVRIRARLSVNTADAAIAAAEHGLGIARTLSYQVAAAVAAGRLSLVLDEPKEEDMPVSIVYPARRGGSVGVKAFVSAARAYFAGSALG